MKEDEELEGMNIVSADIFFCSFCLYVNHVKTPKWGKDRWCVSDETVAQATISRWAANILRYIECISNKDIIH
jgi:hypothetical protein